jgi:hypothetical protein
VSVRVSVGVSVRVSVDMGVSGCECECERKCDSEYEQTVSTKMSVSFCSHFLKKRKYYQKRACEDSRTSQSVEGV